MVNLIIYNLYFNTPLTCGLKLFLIKWTWFWTHDLCSDNMINYLLFQRHSSHRASKWCPFSMASAMSFSVLPSLLWLLGLLVATAAHPQDCIIYRHLQRPLSWLGSQEAIRLGQFFGPSPIFYAFLLHLFNYTGVFVRPYLLLIYLLFFI